MQRRHFLLVMAASPLTCTEAEVPPGTVAKSRPDVVSGTMKLSIDELATGTFEIYGEGHVHDVPVTEAALKRLRHDEVLYIRSGPAKGHSHWVEVVRI